MASEALDTITRLDFDVIFMDVQMPEMDGLTATGKIREGERQTQSHLPIIAMTAHAMNGDRERCLNAGMDGYIPKPINGQELEKAIAGALYGRDAAQVGKSSKTHEQDAAPNSTISWDVHRLWNGWAATKSFSMRSWGFSWKRPQTDDYIATCNSRGKRSGYRKDSPQSKRRVGIPGSFRSLKESA